MYLDSTDSAPADGFYNISLGLFKYLADQSAIQFGADKLQGTALSSTTPTSGQVLFYNGANWMPSGIIGHGTGAPSGTSTGEYYIQYYAEGYAPADIKLDIGDPKTDLTVLSSAYTFRMPYSMYLTGVRASLTQEPAGSDFIVDINENGTSVLGSKLTIDDGTKTSVNGGSPYTITDNLLADDAEITIDIDQIGSTQAGQELKVWLLGTRL